MNKICCRCDVSKADEIVTHLDNTFLSLSDKVDPLIRDNVDIPHQMDRPTHFITPFKIQG